jgi:4-amino-4-deoxy-L-arabinose transferase-like glycosyltransferase
VESGGKQSKTIESIKYMDRRIESAILWALFGAFAGYILIRAWVIPITHDEAATCFNHVPRLVIDTLMYEREANPNNHILNTLAIKLLTGLFGWHQFTVRIPVLLGGLIYGWTALLLARRMSDQSWVRIFTVLVLLGNPYLNEFFSLARGYGLAVGLMAAAIYQTVLFFDRNESRYAVRAMVLAGLAVYANFTLLLFFAPFSAALFLALWQQNPAFDVFWLKARPVFVAAFIFTALWYLPLGRLSKDNEIKSWAAVPSFLETVRLLVQGATRNHSYTGPDTARSLAWAIMLFSAGSWVVAILRHRIHRWRFGADLGYFAAFLLFGTVLTNFVQVGVTKTPYLQARLSLFYYPLIALALAGVAQWMWQRYREKTWLLFAPILVLLLINNARNLNFFNAYEWWFDRYTFVVLNKIKDLHLQEKRAKPFELNSDWIVQNSLGIHVEKMAPKYEQFIKMLPAAPNGQPPRPEGDFFYALSKEQVEALKAQYEPILVLEPEGYVLLRRK